MDLRTEFENILVTYGHNVYIQKRVDLDGTGIFKDVAGGKYEESLETWTAWRRPLRVGQSASADGFMRLDEEGLYSNYDLVYYFQPESQIKVSDKVIESTPHERSRRHETIVKKAVPYYLGEEEIYIAAYCDRVNPVSA